MHVYIMGIDTMSNLPAKIELVSDQQLQGLGSGSTLIVTVSSEAGSYSPPTYVSEYPVDSPTDSTVSESQEVNITIQDVQNAAPGASLHLAGRVLNCWPVANSSIWQFILYIINLYKTTLSGLGGCETCVVVPVTLPFLLTFGSLFMVAAITADVFVWIFSIATLFCCCRLTRRWHKEGCCTYKQVYRDPNNTYYIDVYSTNLSCTQLCTYIDQEPVVPVQMNQVKGYSPALCAGLC
eukprot:TRINITY_DN3880_c0_g1_i1.p1 TRINITY_DN3880_c0_g1~~TRINITY_DN3880_c0_g1_i1.p1  ORF type:complete len:237 (+),score=3.22 TRINITY_DN3880_c0_g1_i1:221-931(+)